MKNKRVVLALGGNALGNNPGTQLQKCRHAARFIADMIQSGSQAVITHGNGPQVGLIASGLETAARSGILPSDMPFPECGAMSQGYIGYHLQTALQAELAARGISREVAAVITQVEVDGLDPAFRDPTKPVGIFYTREEAEKLAAETGLPYREDAGRGWRRVVPSPRPLDVIEKETIRKLADAGCIVIAAGGGGIPVIRKDKRLEGVPAVIDKDLAASLLADLVEADTLLILTAVEGVFLRYGHPNAQFIPSMTASEARQFCEQGFFAPGSMLPKVQAAMAFAQHGGKAIIASLDMAAEAMRGESGTMILADP
ncbi:MAG: carbamate kinase [Clostridia bacterium]|nr:carbamate kinase [Clostridia bacterium]